MKREPASLGGNPLSPVLAAVRRFIDGPSESLPSALPGIVPSSALGILRDRFELAPFDLAVLACGAALELVPGFARSCGVASGNEANPILTPALCIARLPGARWQAFAPDGTLRRFRLIRLAEGEVFTGRALSLPESVLHFLIGEPVWDPRLEARARGVAAPMSLPPSRAKVVSQIVANVVGPEAPHVQLVTHDVEHARPLFAAAAEARGLRLWELPGWALPESSEEREELAWTYARDARLCGGWMLLDLTNLSDPARQRQALELASRLPEPIAIVGPEVLRPPARAVLSFALPHLDHDERKALWEAALDRFAPSAVNGSRPNVSEVAACFDLSPEGIAAAARSMRREAEESPEQSLWRACRLLARARLDDLAQRIEPEADWNRLILPPPEVEVLRAIEAQVRHRARVLHDWGFSAQGARGNGTAAIFAGPSGTGKTLAAEVLARALNLDLYRVDLSAVVSKYIGETEKNLRRVFDAAEEGGAVLLFDEADALFGKRTEVKDSHDRHANIEVSYLLQRMESYQGLAILTTNLRKNIDDAFLRRIQFVVDFPFPDAKHREKIWRVMFPPQTPVNGLDPRLLAGLAVAGGNIKNIARNAAYLAAGEEVAVAMRHVLGAARLEYAKLGQPLTPPEIRGWLS